jgi:hypothetical protein
MNAEGRVEFQREFQAERIDGRKDWVRYVELKTAMYRAHVARVESELAPILDDVLRHQARRAATSQTDRR